MPDDWFWQLSTEHQVILLSEFRQSTFQITLATVQYAFT
jgi:hypothetical protein